MSAVSPLALQALQTETFESYSAGEVFQAVIMTLQDNGYAVTQIETIL
jgi:hypothetical protein